MPAAFTLDASFFLNVFDPLEAGHPASRDLLNRLQAISASIVVPTLVLPEVAGAASRARGDAIAGQRYATELVRLPNIEFVSLDTGLAHQAAYIAATHRLRGADAVYAAVAQRFAAVLVTRDRQQRERLAPVVTIRSPEEALAEDLGSS